jgi:VWFA-related protein
MLKVRFRTLALIALVAAFTTPAAHAQLTVALRDLDFSGLPRVTFKACVERDGQLVRGLDAGNFRLAENGMPRQLVMRCPDPADINSVIEVLDNSGSIFAVLPKVIEAAGRLIDSLGSTDEAAVLAFGRAITLAQDFTTDKAALKAALQTLNANGGTPLYDATYEAVTLLAQRSGNRHAVVITDGADTQSSRTVDDVIPYARASRVRLYTIAFNIALPDQKPMERMALETGGSFFVVERPSELAAVYERIAAEITERCCVAEYTSTSCADTLRDLELTVIDGTNTAMDRGSFASPTRPLEAHIAIDVPTDLTPFTSGMAWVSMTPAPDPALLLTMSFTIAYDEQLVDIEPLLPFTLGTTAQNQVVGMSKIAPGRMRLAFNRVRPVGGTNRLVGFPLQALVADSSRRVVFTIEDIVLEGCPVVFTADPDTTTICQCRVPAEASFSATTVLADAGTALVDVRVHAQLESGAPLEARLRMTLPPEVSVRTVEAGALLPLAALRWRVDGGRVLMIDIDPATPVADTSQAIVRIVLQVPNQKDTRDYPVRVDSAEVWQRCCTDAIAPRSMVVLADGACERVLARTSAPGVTVAPNPVRGAAARVRLVLPAEQSVALHVVDLEGRSAGTAFEGVLAGGVHVIDLDTRGLPSGSYRVVAMTEGGAGTAQLVVVK